LNRPGNEASINASHIEKGSNSGDDSDAGVRLDAAKRSKNATDPQPNIKEYLNSHQQQPQSEKSWKNATTSRDIPGIENLSWKTELFTIEDTDMTARGTDSSSAW
jgi:hypothetical protein